MKSEIFDQNMDHFNAYTYPSTFKQRWFYNDTYWSGPQKLGPIFFQAGGEGANNGFIYDFIIELAKTTNALLVTAEHRFYGKSHLYPSSDYAQDSTHLGLLQVEQAMADYLQLMTYWKDLFNCPRCPTLVVGGSYPGELSAFLRMKYPHIFDMALAASAPIFYTADDLVSPYAYYRVVTDAVRKLSPSCVDYVRWAYGTLLASTAAEITAAIPLCTPLPTQRDTGIDELLALLYEIWANYAMGNYPPANSGLKAACQRVEDGDINDGLAVWSRFLSPLLNDGCLQLSDHLPAGANARIHCSDLTGCGSGMNGESWDYQACAQMIEPFATDNVTDMFPRWPWNMTWLNAHCESRFGIRASDRETWMETEFGLRPDYFDKFGQLFSRIIFSNGLLDGWSAGGVLANISETVIAVVIPNGAHHSDMKGGSDYDTQDMIDARNQERAILTQWIMDLQMERKEY